MFVQRLQKYCTRHVIARETKITFIKQSQSGRGGEVFGRPMLLTVRECIWENNADQVVLYQQVKVCVGISKGTDTLPHDSPAFYSGSDFDIFAKAKQLLSHQLSSFQLPWL